MFLYLRNSEGENKIFPELRHFLHSIYALINISRLKFLQSRIKNLEINENCTLVPYRVTSDVMIVVCGCMLSSRLLCSVL